MAYAKARDGAKLYYKDWGEGRPVVLLHGWPLTSDTFDDMAIALAQKGFRAIFPDRRGFGRSEQTWNGNDYDSYADDVAAVLDDAGVVEHGGDIIGVAVIVVAVPGLLRPAKAAAVREDGAEALLRKRDRHVVECVAGQRPAVEQDNRAAFAPILIVKFRAVPCLGIGHGDHPSVQW